MLINYSWGKPTPTDTAKKIDRYASNQNGQISQWRTFLTKSYTWSDDEDARVYHAFLQNNTDAAKRANDEVLHSESIFQY